jgi:lipocalin
MLGRGAPAHSPCGACGYLTAVNDQGYLWILARERQLPTALLEDLLARARKAGFATDALIFPGGAAP